MEVEQLAARGTLVFKPRQWPATAERLELSDCPKLRPGRENGENWRFRGPRRGAGLQDPRGSPQFPFWTQISLGKWSKTAVLAGFLTFSRDSRHTGSHWKWRFLASRYCVLYLSSAPNRRATHPFPRVIPWKSAEALVLSRSPVCAWARGPSQSIGFACLIDAKTQSLCVPQVSVYAYSNWQVLRAVDSNSWRSLDTVLRVRIRYREHSGFWWIVPVFCLFFVSGLESNLEGVLNWKIVFFIVFNTFWWFWRKNAKSVRKNEFSRNHVNFVLFAPPLSSFEWFSENSFFSHMCSACHLHSHCDAHVMSRFTWIANSWKLKKR